MIILLSGRLRTADPLNWIGGQVRLPDWSQAYRTIAKKGVISEISQRDISKNTGSL